MTLQESGHTVHDNGVKAIDIKPGDFLPPIDLAAGVRRQRVLEVEYLLNGRLHVVTDQGEFTASAYLEKVCWPKRADGTTVDWRQKAEAPFPHELAVGDLLPSPGGAGYFTPQQMRDPSGGFVPGFDDPQLVSKIVLVPWHGELFHKIHVRHPTNPKFWRFHRTQRVTFPAPRVNVSWGPPAPGTPPPAGKLVWFGPYENQLTGATWEFSRHPHGHGRWPAEVQPYDPNLFALPTGEPRRGRFPATDWHPELVALVDGLPIGIKRKKHGPYVKAGGGLSFN